MKKILLSCVTCLLALGLVTACDNEEEEVTPNEPETTEPSTGGDNGGNDGGVAVYKLGALDETDYTYKYFSGEASGNYLAVTSSYKDAAEVTITDAGSTASQIVVSFSFIDGEGATKYISWSDGTNVDISDEPYAWYWVEESTIFAAESSSGRALVLYTNNPSIRAYAQTETNLAYPHLRVYSEEPILAAPTTLTVNGENQVYVGGRITLSVVAEAGADRSVTWSWESVDGVGAVTVEGGVVTGVTAGTVKVTATSVLTPSLSASIEITVLETPDEIPYDTETEYLLGYDRNGTYYFFTGEVYSTYYGEVSTDTDKAVAITIEKLDDGYALKCGEAYLYMDGGDDGTHHNFKWDGTQPVAWTYDFTNDVFTIDDNNGDTYFMGSSGTWNEITMNKLSSGFSSNLPARLIAPSAPTSIAITGLSTVYVGRTIQLSIEYEGTAVIKGVTWSVAAGTGSATITEDGILTGVSEGTVSVTATSTADKTIISDTYTITVSAIPEGLVASYDFSLGSNNTNSKMSVAQTQTYFDESFVVGSSEVSPVTVLGSDDEEAEDDVKALNPVNAYPTAGGSTGGSNPNTNLQLSNDCLKLGGSGNAGSVHLEFPEESTVNKVVVYGTSWASSGTNSSAALKINATDEDEGTKLTQTADAVTDISSLEAVTFDITSATQLLIESTNRLLIFSIEFYSVTAEEIG